MQQGSKLKYRPRSQPVPTKQNMLPFTLLMLLFVRFNCTAVVSNVCSTTDASSFVSVFPAVARTVTLKLDSGRRSI